MSMLEDGVYDVMIIDCREEHDERGEMVVHIDVVISASEHRGEVVALTARHLSRSSIELLGTPTTLTVVDGAPRIDV